MIPLRMSLAGEANPSLGYTFSDRYLREQVHKLEVCPRKKALCVGLIFCQWVDADNPWINSETWMQCENTFTFDDLQVKSVMADWTYREQRFNRISLVFSSP